MDVQLGFIKGMQQDVSPVKRDKDSYYSALNMRVITAEGLSTGSITNDLGNEILFRLPKIGKATDIYDIKLGTTVSITIASVNALVANTTPTGDDTYADTLYNQLIANSTISGWITAHKIYIKNNRNSVKVVIYDYDATSYINVFSASSRVLSKGTVDVPKIIGYTQLRDSLILFTAIDSIGSNQIWKLDYNFAGNTITNLTITNYLQPYYHLKYVELLGMPSYIRCGEILTKYNNDGYGKIYWPNGDTLRHLNILDPDCLGTLLGETQLLPNVIMKSPRYREVLDGGSLKAGMIQYGYQLYNYGGAETVISPTTPLIHLVATPVSESDTRQYRGSEIEDATNKAVKISIDNIDVTFQYIKIWSVFYSAKGSPVITLIFEEKVAGTTMEFIDTGTSSLDTLTQGEFVSIGGVVFNPKTITIKDNYLIAGNIQEDTFDIDEELGYYWDSRAYRWYLDKLDGGTWKFKVDETVYTSAVGLDEEANCRFLESDYSNYKYNKNSGLIGGAGENIWYDIITGEVIIDSYANDAKRSEVYKGNLQWATWGGNTEFDDIVDYPDFSSPYNHAYLAGYCPGETYSFGIEFFDDKSRRSFVKWIGDIRFPTYDELPTTNDLARVVGNDVKSRTLGIKFFVTSVPTGYNWRIVRCERQDIDKTVVDTVVLKGVDKVTGADYYATQYNFAYPMGIKATNNVLRWVAVSPNICFNKLTTITGLSVYKLAKFTSDINEQMDKIDYNITLTDGNILHALTKYLVASDETYSSVGTISDSIVLSQGWEATYLLNGDTYPYVNSNKPFNPSGQGFEGYTREGRGIYFALTGSSLTANNLYIVNLVRSGMDYTRYGGTSYAARSRRDYIPCTKIQSGDTGSSGLPTFGGDTYNVMFDYQQQTSATNLTTNESIASATVFLPMVTSFNSMLRHDTCASRSSNYNQRWKLQDSKSTGVSVFDNPDTTDIDAGDYPTTFTDLYLINDVYTMENTTVRGFPKPLNFVSNPKVDYRIISSQPSIANEAVDSWTKYYPNDYIDLDSQYGEINKILVNNNILVSLQDNGFAAVAFKDRQLLQDELQGQLVLGTGSILSYVRYISTKTGTRNRWSVVDLDSNMMWFDTTNRKVMRYSQSEGLEILSDNKNMTSFFRNNYLYIRDDDFYTGVHGVVDKKDNRVYFTFSNNSDALPDSMVLTGDNKGLTISYNLALGQFESLHTFAPRLFMDTEIGLVSTYNSITGWLHGDTGTYCNYYGTQYGSYLEHMIGTTTKVSWTNIEFNSDDTQPDNLIFTDSYGTGFTTNLIRRFRTYRAAIPRHNDGSTQRFVDYYIKSKVVYNSTPTVVRLDDITLKYLIPLI